MHRELQKRALSLHRGLCFCSESTSRYWCSPPTSPWPSHASFFLIHSSLSPATRATGARGWGDTSSCQGGESYCVLSGYIRTVARVLKEGGPSSPGGQGSSDILCQFLWLMSTFLEQQSSFHQNPWSSHWLWLYKWRSWSHRSQGPTQMSSEPGLKPGLLTPSWEVPPHRKPWVWSRCQTCYQPLCDPEKLKHLFKVMQGNFGSLHLFTSKKEKVLSSLFLSPVCWRKGEGKYLGIRVLVFETGVAAVESSSREPQGSLGICGSVHHAHICLSREQDIACSFEGENEPFKVPVNNLAKSHHKEYWNSVQVIWKHIVIFPAS